MTINRETRLLQIVWGTLHLNALSNAEVLKRIWL